MTDTEVSTVLQQFEVTDAIKKQAANDLKKVKKVSDLVAIVEYLFPPNNGIEPSMLSSVQKKLDQASIDVIKISDQYDNDAIAFVFKQAHGEYGLFIHNKAEKISKKWLELHEYGHIIFNHCQGVAFHKKQFEVVLDRMWSTVQKFFDKESVQWYDKEKLVNFLYHRLANTAMDMEINSKLFDNEWPIAVHTIKRAQFLIWAKTKGQRNQATKEIQAKIEGSKGDLEFCHPSTKKWPEKADWLTYMQYLLNNLKDFIKFDTGTGQGTPGSSQSTGLYRKADIEADDQSRNKQEETEAKNGKEEKNEENGLRRGDSHNKNLQQIQKCKNLKDFEDVIKKFCLNKINRRMHTDVFYYTNRGRNAGNGGVLAPRRHYVDRYFPGAIQVVVDTSGSVPTNQVNKIIKTLLNLDVYDKKRSRCIQWDTQLCADNSLNDKKIKINAGGGTSIDKGILYAGKYLKKDVDKLFVISDCYDDLDAWVSASKKVHGEKIIVCYHNGQDLFKYENKNTIKKLKEQFKIFTVNISEKTS